MQQASKAIEGLGVFSLKEGVISTKHVVHTTEWKVIGKWGIRKWVQSDAKTSQSAHGPQGPKEEACHRTQWHGSIPQILTGTLKAQISGYPLYDRELLRSELLEKRGK